MHLPWFIDGGWFDIATFLVALMAAAAKCHWHGHHFVSRQTGEDILHGIALFPLLMLVVSIFSNEALDSPLHANRLIIGVAGAVALLSILEGEFERGDAEA